MAIEDWGTVQAAQNRVEVEGVSPALLNRRDTATVRAWEISRLEVPAEGTQAEYIPPDIPFDSNTPSSNFAKHGTSQVLDDTSAGLVCDRPAEDAVSAASSARNATPLVDKWLCEHPNCGRAFTHRHKLNRHRKYHIKPHKCLESSCAFRQVAFSLKKDLIRHQAMHSGRRFYCHHPGCRYAFGSAEGFTRQDNLKRHIAAQHS
ncbi:hypothetical protein B0O99DRAFT_689904 [Bisporella sp. PMI_857]|nr:hypothetical protein B0O99DRAFT_689904 [Bisporella sp. PMI_857]